MVIFMDISIFPGILINVLIPIAGDKEFPLLHERSSHNQANFHIWTWIATASHQTPIGNKEIP